jgi:hypothetical protein
LAERTLGGSQNRGQAVDNLYTGWVIDTSRMGRSIVLYIKPTGFDITKGKIMKAVIIKTDGSKSVAEFDNDTCYDLLRTTVGGYFECITLKNVEFCDMWVNEEGKLRGLEQNPTATALWVDMYGTSDVIMGDVIITGGSDDEGETLGLTDALVDYFLQYDREIFFVGGVA